MLNDNIGETQFREIFEKWAKKHEIVRQISIDATNPISLELINELYDDLS
jgi:hypothetical protein